MQADALGSGLVGWPERNVSALTEKNIVASRCLRSSSPSALDYDFDRMEYRKLKH